jgi:hypothetical protein
LRSALLMRMWISPWDAWIAVKGLSTLRLEVTSQVWMWMAVLGHLGSTSDFANWGVKSVRPRRMMVEALAWEKERTIAFPMARRRR